MTFHDDVTRAEQTLSTMRYDTPGTVTTAQDDRTHRFRLGHRAQTQREAGDDVPEAFVLKPMSFAHASKTELWKEPGTSGTSTQTDTVVKAGQIA